MKIFTIFRMHYMIVFSLKPNYWTSHRLLILPVIFSEHLLKYSSFNGVFKVVIHQAIYTYFDILQWIHPFKQIFTTFNAPFLVSSDWQYLSRVPNLWQKALILDVFLPSSLANLYLFDSAFSSDLTWTNIIKSDISTSWLIVWAGSMSHKIHHEKGTIWPQIIDWRSL